MKHYQLASWPDLPPVYHRTAYRRMLHQMSHRPVSLSQLVRTSGLQRHAVRDFLDTLSQKAVLIEGEPSHRFSLIGWIRHHLAG